MNNLNITLNILNGDNKQTQKTYYSITAISKITDPNINRCIVHSNGEQDICLMSFNELWEKLNKINNESTSR